MPYGFNPSLIHSEAFQQPSPEAYNNPYTAVNVNGTRQRVGFDSSLQQQTDHPRHNYSLLSNAHEI
jgi:hypothetical protein